MKGSRGGLRPWGRRRWGRGPSPAKALGDRVHLLGLLGCLLPGEPVVELHQQALGEGLPRPVDAAVVEDLGMLPADAHGRSGLTVQVSAPALPALQRHPAKGRAAWGGGRGAGSQA